MLRQRLLTSQKKRKKERAIICVWIEERNYTLKINIHNTLSEPGSEYSVTAGAGEYVKHMEGSQHRLGCG